MATSVQRIGFLGAGKMATALAQGWRAAGLLAPEQSLASDPFEAARRSFHEATTIRCTADNVEVAANCDVLILAVKPQSAVALFETIRGSLAHNPLLVSIITGISIEKMHEALGAGRRIIRVMPNTPCLVGASASAFAPSESAEPADIEFVDRLLNAVGKGMRLPENLLDAVTGLSGSGPAFVYVAIEALSDGGVRMGLPRDVATLLAAQTVLGAAKMVLESGEHTGKLKDAVASPGGTTIAGLHALERGGFRAALMDAVEAAARRAAELGAN